MPPDRFAPSRRAVRASTALLGSVVLGACSVIGVRGGTPQPRYEVIETIGDGAAAIEIRRYGDRLAAECDETGDEIAARDTGFRRLAGYIFGGNRGGERIAMTAPVAQAPASAGPTVSSRPAADGRWTIRFFLPDTLRATDVPPPRDPSIRIVPVPADTVAVLRFSGTPGAAVVADRKRALLAALAATRWHPAAAPVAWFYDPPWTLPPLRRNEVSVAVTRRDRDAIPTVP